MAVVYAVKNGSWSDTSTWNTGQLPQPGDTVCANGFTVAIDQDVDLWVNSQPAGIITTRAYSPAVAGGGFTCSRSNTTIRCEKIEAYTTALWISASGCVVYGDVYGSNHPSMQYLHGIEYSGTGTLQIYGSVYGGSGANFHYGVYNGSLGTVQITGNVTGGSGGGAYGAYNLSTGTMQITGNVTGGSGSNAYGVINYSSGTVQITGTVTGGSGSNAYGVINYSSGTVQITGTVTGGGADGASGVRNNSSGTVQITGDCLPQASTNAPAVWNSSTGVVYINGTVYSGRNAACVYANNGFIRINGDLRHHESLGNAPAIGTSASGLIVLNGNIRHHYGTTGQFGLCLATGRVLMHDAASTFTEYAEHNGNWLPTGNPALHYGTALHEGTMPSPSDVRYGVTYGPDDIYAGTCRVPPPESVLYGVPVDDTVGTAAVTPEAIAAAVWNAVRDNYSDSGTFGAVGEWAGGGGGGSDWTEAERAQIRHRLGIDGDSAQPQSASPSLAPATAQAVWSHTTRTLTAATTDWTDAERQQIRHRLGIDGQAAQPQSATPSLMAAGGYTTERAQRLDNVDVPVSSRSTLTAAQAAQAVWNHDSRTLTGTVVVGSYVGGQSPGEHMVALGYTSARAGNLDNLDAPVSSRSTLTAADVWSHSPRSLTTAITDWSDDERRQIRYRLGISGDRQQPTGVDPDLALPGDAMTLTQETIEAIAEAVMLGTVQVVVQPLQVHVQRTYTATDTIELWRDARGLISIWLPGVNLSEHELALQVYERSGQTIPTATWRDEITVSVQDQGTLIQADVPRDRMLTAGSYQFVLRDLTSQVVLAHGRLVVHWAPDAT